MLDLSEETKEENIEICAKYFQRMAKIDLWLEMEIGITGGEEDGVDNTGVDNASLYTQPEDIWDIYKALSAISPMFSIAAGFGNVHGVYKRERTSSSYSSIPFFFGLSVLMDLGFMLCSRQRQATP